MSKCFWSKEPFYPKKLMCLWMFLYKNVLSHKSLPFKQILCPKNFGSNILFCCETVDIVVAVVVIVHGPRNQTIGFVKIRSVIAEDCCSCYCCWYCCCCCWWCCSFHLSCWSWNVLEKPNFWLNPNFCQGGLSWFGGLKKILEIS